MKRRKFLAASALLTTGISSTVMAAEDGKYLAHQVYFWLKNPGSDEDRARLISGLRTLEKIKSVLKIYIGVVAAVEKRPVIDDTWSVSLLILNRDVAGQAAYQIDPIHVEFVKNYSGLWEKAVIYDSATV